MKIKKVWFIVEEGADRIYVWANFPENYESPKDRKSEIFECEVHFPDLGTRKVNEGDEIDGLGWAIRVR